MWEVWDKKTPINFEHLKGEETIFIKYVDGMVVQVEGKGILASVYGIDPTLDNEAFIEAYERAIEPTEVEE